MKTDQLQSHPPKPGSICLVVCYFGPFPPYFECVLRSCAANPDIDWLIFTDQTGAQNIPSNVHIRKTTLHELRGLFSAKLGFEVALEKPRQLCNMKPAFGHIFDDSLTGYEFWGHCDLDMIFGDIRKFLTPQILSCYDRILNLGHLCLYRNNQKVNQYFMLETPGVPHYKQVFQQGVEIAFDEWQGIYRIFRYHNIPQYLADVIVDVIPPTRWRFPRFEGIGIENYFSQVFYWYKGKVFQCYLGSHGAPVDVEYAYIHFQKRHLPGPDFKPLQADGFLITPDGFFPYARQELSRQEFCRYNAERLRPVSELSQAAYRSMRRRLRLS
jgi:hypothetical protein